MGKLTLASKLADELGKSTGEAMRFVDDVGVSAARNTLDEAASAGSRTVEKWGKRVLGIGAVGGGGALAWRQQDLSQAKQIASQQQDYSEAVKAIMDSDLPPEKKRELIEQLNKDAPASGQNKDDGGDDGGDNPFKDAQTTIILVIVMIFVLKFALGGDD